MNKRKGAHYADNTEDYIQMAIKYQHKVSPYYDKSESPCSITQHNFMQNFEFSGALGNADEEQETLNQNQGSNDNQMIHKLLIVDTHIDLKLQIQAFCQVQEDKQVTQVSKQGDKQDDYITDFYSKVCSPNDSMHFWLQNYRTNKYQVLKENYLKNFQQFLIVETRSKKQMTMQLIETILEKNDNVKVIYKIKVGNLDNKPKAFSRRHPNVMNIYCTSLLDGLSQVEAMVTI